MSRLIDAGMSDPFNLRRIVDALADFEALCTQMQAKQDRKIWVHCAANMRVSAFINRYRCEVPGEAPRVAGEALSRIWEPFGVWKKFVT